MTELMQARNSFEEIIKEVFSSMLSQEVSVTNEDETPQKEVSVTVFLGIGGLKKYAVIFETDEKFACSAASAMLGEEIKEWSDSVQDAIAEIANMISGNIKSKLPEHLNLSLSIPAVIKGSDYKYMSPGMKLAVTMTLKAFSDGHMTVKIIEEV